MNGKRSLPNRTKLPAAVLGGFALAGLLVGAAPAFAVNNCMQDITTAGGGGTLNCNSNDVRIAHVTNISPISGITGNATDGFKCFSGAPIEFTADFEVDLGAQARYDIGLYAPVTDEDGNYRVPALAPGAYLVTVNSVPRGRPVQIKGDETAKVDLDVTPKPPLTPKAPPERN